MLDRHAAGDLGRGDGRGRPRLGEDHELEQVQGEPGPAQVLQVVALGPVVEQIAHGGSHAGVALGALAGLAIGLTIDTFWALANLFGPPPKNSGLPTVLGLLGGGTLGALAGRPGPWEVVYP